MEREAGQGERDIKEMRVDVESLRKKADATGWSAEKEEASEEAFRRAKGCAVHGCVFILSIMHRFLLKI